MECSTLQEVSFTVNGSLQENCMSPTESFNIGKVEELSATELKNSTSTPINKSENKKLATNNLSLPLEKDNRLYDSKSHCNGSFEVTQEAVDGTDSGVEIIRALSSNGSNSDRFTPIQSCGSSLVSYSSEPEVDRGSECGSECSEKGLVRKTSDCANQCLSNGWKSKKLYVKTERSRIVNRKANNYDGEVTSESCSETSSTHEAVTPDQLNRSIDFKRSGSYQLHESKKCENGKSTVGRRSESSTRNNSYDKISGRSHSSVRASSSASKANLNLKSASTSRNVKSTASGKCELKGTKTKIEDSRWSSQKNSSGARIRVSSVADPLRRSNLSPMSSSMTSSLNAGNTKNSLSEGKSNALDKYGTLPRRTKKKVAESLAVSAVQSSLSRSNSVSRDPSLNRAATLRRQQSKEKENSTNSKTLPPYPRNKKSTGKTVIYHEVSCQTIITGQDITTDNNGVHINEKGANLVVEKESKGIQTEGKERLKKIEETLTKQSEELENMKKENNELKLQKKEFLFRICKILGSTESNDETLEKNGLNQLEEHFQAVGLTVIKQQEELSELRHYKLIAHRDLEKSLAAQKNLLQQQQEIEEEYSELQEFLQAEKTALSESLVDTEEELNKLRSEIAKKESLLEQQQEECKHLVRICEQRRQENLSLEAKLAGLDQRSRDVLVQQGAAVSAAAVALSGLGDRLDTLVEQLAVSCNITEKDLEDVIFHNEAYSQSEDDSPDSPLSQTDLRDEPKPRDSFLQVILGAIRNAAHSPFATVKKNKSSEQNPEPLVFFDTDSEPCLNFETVLEESPSLSNCTDFESSSRTETKKAEKEDVDCSSSVVEYQCGLSRSDSLQNLSDAILNRQLIEKTERSGSLDEIIPIEVNSLVDQIIDVDNLVTKLLKVIRIIQVENERCVKEIQGKRDDLSNQLQEEKLTRDKLENNLQRLKQELTEARSQLNTRILQLEEAKALLGENQRVTFEEIQKKFSIIDTALGALNSVRDIVNQCPPLAKLRLELEDCNYQRTPGSDVNANSATNENRILGDVRCNGPVLTTAI